MQKTLLLAAAIAKWMGKQGNTGINIRAAAKRIGIAPSYLSEILQGKRPNLRKELLYKIADTIEISREDAFLLHEIDNPFNPDAVKEKLRRAYENKQNKYDDSVREFYQATAVENEITKEKELMADELATIWRLRRTPEIWDIYRSVVTGFLKIQDDYIEDLSQLGQGEYLAEPRDIKSVFQKMGVADAIEITALDYKKKARFGYMISAIRVPRHHGTFEAGGVTAYGFEMGLVLAGEGIFYSKGLRDHEYKQQKFSAHKVFCFSRHRHHSIVASQDMEIFHIQFPYNKATHKLPAFFCIENGKFIKYPVRRSEKQEFFIPLELEELIIQNQNA